MFNQHVHQVKATPKRASIIRATSPDSRSAPEGVGTGDLSPMRRRTHWLLLGRETELRVVTQCIRVAGRVGGGGRVVMIEVRQTEPHAHSIVNTA
jgi:hypothetical protein